MVRALLTLLLLAGAAGTAGAGGRPVILQSTTSTENSGLLAHLEPLFESATGFDLRVVAVGTGQAIRNAARGDGDVLLVHDPEAEEAFVAAGHGVARRPVMENDFVLVGPAADPAGVAGLSPTEALARIRALRAPFASRGDGSGTHRAELRLWGEAEGGPPNPRAAWYREMGQGMGATLNAATAMGAYALTDRATWAAFGNRGAHRVLVEGGPHLRNPYAVIVVDPARHPGVEAEGGRAFADWITGAEGQAAIGAFRIEGAPAFRPAARAPAR